MKNTNFLSFMLLVAMSVGLVACKTDDEKAFEELLKLENNSSSDDSSSNGTATVDRSGDVNGHAAIDLGLPSGLLWATCNIGAVSPEEEGNYYSWGTISKGSEYSWKEYALGDSCKLTKYCFDINEYPEIKSYWSGTGKCDSISTLDQSDDVAYQLWKGTWRMPTIEELHELHSNCKCEWTTQNGVAGMKMTSEKNNRSIFLPAAGYKDYVYNSDKKEWETLLINKGECGGYWSSSLYIENPNKAQRMHITAGNVAVEDICFRNMGQVVRAVCVLQ